MSEREETKDFENNEVEQVKEEEKQEQEEKALKFFVALGDCDPVIYHIAVAFGTSIDKLSFNDDTLKRLVEETNEALHPVFEKFNAEMMPDKD